MKIPVLIEKKLSLFKMLGAAEKSIKKLFKKFFNMSYFLVPLSDLKLFTLLPS